MSLNFTRFRPQFDYLGIYDFSTKINNIFLIVRVLFTAVNLVYSLPHFFQCIPRDGVSSDNCSV